MSAKTIEKTIKLKLIPLTKNDRDQLHSLLEEYTIMIKEGMDIIIENDARSRKKAHDLCYAFLRKKTHICTTSLSKKRIREL